VRSIRNARAEFTVDPARQIEAVIAAGREFDLLANQIDVVATLARLDRRRLVLQPTVDSKPKQALTLVSGDVEVYLPLAGMVDLEAERARLQKEISSTHQDIERAEKLLANPGFTTKAPAAVVEKERQKLSEGHDRLARLQERLRALSGDQ
jgi:valyl-tRNA synthetase